MGERSFAFTQVSSSRHVGAHGSDINASLGSGGDLKLVHPIPAIHEIEGATGMDGGAVSRSASSGINIAAPLEKRQSQLGGQLQNRPVYPPAGHALQSLFPSLE